MTSCVQAGNFRDRSWSRSACGELNFKRQTSNTKRQTNELGAPRFPSAFSVQRLPFEVQPRAAAEPRRSSPAPILPEPRRSSPAYVLLEMIIALTVFAIVATGLASALHSALDSANFLRRQVSIRHGLESILVESKARPKREEMPMTYKDDALGVEFRSELEELKWINRHRKPVKGLYILRAIATDLRLGKRLHDTAEVYVYRP